MAGERVLRVKRTRGSPGCDFYASLKYASQKYFPFVRLQAEAWRIEWLGCWMVGSVGLSGGWVYEVLYVGGG